MSCCCSKILDLCDVDGCTGDIDFNIKAQANGVHRVEIEFLDSIIELKKTFSIGDDIKFSASSINENFSFLCALYQPDGGRISVNKDNVVYDCFAFTTKTILFSENQDPVI